MKSFVIGVGAGPGLSQGWGTPVFFGAGSLAYEPLPPRIAAPGDADGGASIDGLTPIDPDTARHLAARAPGWDRLLCDPVTGSVLEVDRYAPTTSQRRFLAARDRHCRAPGCRAPIARCQIDHNHEAHEGGPTRLDNLCHLCVRHHTLKTETGWTVTQERDGTLRLNFQPTGIGVTPAQFTACRATPVGRTARTITVSTTDEDGSFTLGTQEVAITNVAPSASRIAAAKRRMTRPPSVAIRNSTRAAPSAIGSIAPTGSCAFSTTNSLRPLMLR